MKFVFPSRFKSPPRPVLLRFLLVGLSVLSADPAAAQLGPVPPLAIGTTATSAASGAALAAATANLATLTANTAANTAAIASAQAAAMAALPSAKLGQASGPAQLDSLATLNGNVVGGRTLLARAQDRVNILDYGAKCDGLLVPAVTSSGAPLNQQWHGTAANASATVFPGWVGKQISYYTGSDDTAAISAALTVALAENKPLYIPGSFPGTGGATGYCLMKSGNPLGQDATHSGAITAPLTIEGDGKDVSRLVWFADDVFGSFTGIGNNAGTGYQVGDTVGVLGTDNTVGLLLTIVATNSTTGAVTAAVAKGNATFRVATSGSTPANIPGKNAATSNSCTTGCSSNGTGLTVNILAGGPAIVTPAQQTFAARINGVTFRNFSLIGTGQQNPGQGNCGADPYSLWSVNDIVADGIGIDYSRCLSFTSRQSQNTVITRSRIRWSARDMINVSSSRVVVSNNTLEHGGDDSIATPDQPAESGAEPFREGVVISGNFITDAAGIDVLGGAGVSVTGNTLVRPKGIGITVSSSFMGGNEGSTPSRSIVVSGNSITDVFNVLNDPIFGGTQARCITIGSVVPMAGTNGGATGAGVPGFPTSTGSFVSPYETSLGGVTSWPMLVNGNSAGLSTAPTGPGIGMVVANNSCIRTLPIDATEWFSALGFGQTYGAAGWMDFLLDPDAAWGVLCLDDRYGTLTNVRIQGNICSGAKWGMSIDASSHLYDATVKDNTFRDIRYYGLEMPTAPAGQKIVFEDNLWDGDPYFSAPQRTVVAGSSPAVFTGGWTSNGGSNLPVLLNAMPTQGIEWLHNRIKNWAAMGQSWSNLNRAVGNQIYLSTNSSGAQTGVGGGQFIGSALPAAGQGWEYMTEDGDPRSATFGQVLAATTRDLASGCIAGNYSGATAGSQCVTPQNGITLSGTGALGISYPLGQNSAIAGITLSNGGVYNAPPTCTIGAPAAGGKQATCAPTLLHASGTLSTDPITGGSGYAVGDIVSVNGGTCSMAPQLRVTSISSGAITGIGGYAGGHCTVMPSNPASLTAVTGSGTGGAATVYYTIDQATVTAGGTGYTQAPAVTFSSGHLTAVGAATLQSTLLLGAGGTSGAPVVSQGATVDGSKVDMTADGTALTVPSNTSWLVLTQTGTVSSQTITLPSTPVDGQILRINSKGAISSLTLSPSVAGAPASLAAGGGFALGWDAASGSWLMVQ